jgi:type I restriction enzyme M protein
MSKDHFDDLSQFEADLWQAADNLRANSNLASNEYFMPILGLIFLRHATNRYYTAVEAIEAEKAAGKMPDRPLVEADFTSRRALMLPETARYDVLREMPKDGNLGAGSVAIASKMALLSTPWTLAWTITERVNPSVSCNRRRSLTDASGGV